MVNGASKYLIIFSALSLLGNRLQEPHIMEGRGSTYNSLFKQTLLGQSNVKKVVHLIKDKQPIGENRLYEYIDDKNITQCFGREIFTGVCNDGSCKPVRLRLYWDAIGDFLKYELPEGEGLEKNESDVFTKKDYKKLTEVLQNPVSVLNNYKIDELGLISKADVLQNPDPTLNTHYFDEVVLKSEENDTVDGVTGATVVAIKDAVVEGAVYTTYTLWHIVYGQTRTKIKELVEQKQDTSFMLHMLNSSKSSYQLWAIDQIKTKRLLQNQHFYPVIIAMLNGKDETVANWALDLFEKDDLADSKIQCDLYRVFDRSSISMKFNTLNKLRQAETPNQEIVIKLLEDFIEDNLGPGIFTYIMDLTANIKEANELLLSKLISLLSHPNFFVSRRVYMYLDTLENTAVSLQNELLKFRDAHQNGL
ncbi:hypothetical protein ACFL6U_23480 [Planctomycetota bacterium]